MLLAANDSDSNKASSKLQRGGDRLLKARRNTLFDEEPVHDDFNGVILALVEVRGNVQRKEFAVDSHANVAILCQLFELLAIGAFSAPDDRRQNHDAIVGLTQLPIE